MPRKEVYCDNCGNYQPMVEHELHTDELDPYPWYDITCGTCAWIIATVQMVPDEKPVALPKAGERCVRKDVGRQEGKASLPLILRPYDPGKGKVKTLSIDRQQAKPQSETYGMVQLGTPSKEGDAVCGRVVHCEAETTLYLHDVPICPECDSLSPKQRIENNSPPVHQKRCDPTCSAARLKPSIPKQSLPVVSPLVRNNAESTEQWPALGTHRA